ncbi:Uncharacterised protein [Yersinia enterocolitica]|nr:Uncharacterised protein [Yersinia enterocolitica]
MFYSLVREMGVENLQNAALHEIYFHKLLVLSFESVYFI